MLTCYCDMETFDPYIEREYRGPGGVCGDCGAECWEGES